MSVCQLFSSLAFEDKITCEGQGVLIDWHHHNTPCSGEPMQARGGPYRVNACAREAIALEICEM